MNEWKDVKGYEGIYLVSNTGEIRSLKYNKNLKPFLTHWGYLRIVLNKDKKTKTTFVHRVVASAFIPNPDNKPQVNHIDGNKQNNRVENLEWVSDKENKIHGFKNGLFDNHYSIKIYQADLKGNIVKVWKSKKSLYDAKVISDTLLNKTLKSRNPIAKGFIWLTDIEDLRAYIPN